MKRKCRKWVVVIVLVWLNVSPSFCKAQQTTGSTVLETPVTQDAPLGIDPATDPDAPIDGGVGLLLAAGLGYGFIKANNKRKRNKTADLLGKHEPQ